MDCKNNAGNFYYRRQQKAYRNVHAKSPKPDWRGLGEIGTNTRVLVNQAGQVLAASAVSTASRAKQEPATTFDAQALGATQV